MAHTVLVVEDNVVIREGLAVILRRNGWTREVGEGPNRRHDDDSAGQSGERVPVHLALLPPAVAVGLHAGRPGA